MPVSRTAISLIAVVFPALVPKHDKIMKTLGRVGCIANDAFKTVSFFTGISVDAHWLSESDSQCALAGVPVGRGALLCIVGLRDLRLVTFPSAYSNVLGVKCFGEVHSVVVSFSFTSFRYKFIPKHIHS